MRADDVLASLIDYFIGSGLTTRYISLLHQAVRYLTPLFSFFAIMCIVLVRNQ